MPLPDVYCLFNRARGTELVSPDDLLAAVQVRTWPRRIQGVAIGFFSLHSALSSPPPP